MIATQQRMADRARASIVEELIVGQTVNQQQQPPHLVRRPALWCAWLALCMLLSNTARLQAEELSPLETLGKLLFFDETLSNPVGQSCASCHAPEVGFTGPDPETNAKGAVYEGAAAGRFGNRKPPSAAYAAFSPKRSYNTKDSTYVGGQFWDGRADSLIEQAKGPFLNPLEMNNPNAAAVVDKVRRGPHRHRFEAVFGQSALRDDAATTDRAFDRIARAIAAYESSKEVNPFSSKYDLYLAGKAKLTPQEQRGLALYEGKAACQKCHPHQPDDEGAPPLFTDFTYDNLGIPANKANPFYRATASVNPDGDRYRDPGIGGITKEAEHLGKFKVPTLRNIGKRPSPDFVKAYFHNGALKSLKEVVHFYNIRDAQPQAFAGPETPQTVNKAELGNLKLSDAEEDDLVAFLETLSDGYEPDSDSGSPTANPPSNPPSDSGAAASSDEHQDYGLSLRRVQRFLNRRRSAQAARDPAMDSDTERR